MAELSPMMRQYLEIKEQNKDNILFFRLGDFYEMFFDDAKVASEELDLVLTGRDCGQEERAPMCGVPYHSCEGYIARLVEKGYNVAICEQTEDPATAKGIVRREVVRVITPGTVIEDSMLEEGKNNFLAAIANVNSAYSVCFADASTGEVNVTEISGEEVEARIINELGRFSPTEIIADDSVKTMTLVAEFIESRLESKLTVLDKSYFNPALSESQIASHFNVTNIETLNIVSGSAIAASIGAVLGYLTKNGMSSSSAIKNVNIYTDSQYARIDINTIRNLELCETMRGKSKRGSLLWVLDKTKTAMGKRLMRSWVEQPLLSISEIIARQNAVEELTADSFLLGESAEYLSGIRDISRVMTRISYGIAGANDLKNLSHTMAFFPLIKQLLSQTKCKVLRTIQEDIDCIEEIKALIDASIIDNPPTSVREGGIIKEGYNSEVDLLRNDVNNGTDFIAEIEAKERERTGIKNLKVRYNRVFGYYIEVSNLNKDKVPEDYIRKQTLTNCERYINDELKKVESRVLGAKERVVQLEYELFEQVRTATANELVRFQKTANAIAKLDVLCSFATVANQNGYCRPQLNNEGIINIKEGRHPVVEQVSKIPFVANDTLLDVGENRCCIITGPNMAGKSTFMRQVAVITLLAQIGSFVPATSANIGIVDAIFTRVGASDDLASGQSTFMVEMSEVANILKNATKNSLLILDEIGRGTSTFDGMSIAKAVLEFACDKRKLGAKTLFATHYHELTQLEGEMTGVKNYNIAVRKSGDDIIFLRKIVPGGADDSYGIQVAKLAGVPDAVISRSKQILREIESEGVVRTVVENNQTSNQISFEELQANKLLKDLRALDTNAITPLDALKILSDLVEQAKSI
ncbi:MAG: DNA mismatch repair protein MutS [Clostridia bacterium]|nr:DNA mismatch repair protein MutS [Clostridia bacterium]